MMARPFEPKGSKVANPAGLPGIGATTRVRNGRRYVPSTPKMKADDPRLEAMSARCRQFGIEDEADNRVRMRAPYMGSHAGMAIGAIHPDHARATELWDVWQAYCRATRTWRIRILGRSGEPATSASSMVAYGILDLAQDVDQGAGADPRTDEEKDQAARDGRDAWDARLGRCDPTLRVALLGAERGDGPVLFKDGKPSARGRDLVRALEHLHRLFFAR